MVCFQIYQDSHMYKLENTLLAYPTILHTTRLAFPGVVSKGLCTSTYIVVFFQTCTFINAGCEVQIIHYIIEVSTVRYTRPLFSTTSTHTRS